MAPESGEGRPHLVVITAFLPWPLTTGGQVRQFHLLDAARRRARLTLVVDELGKGTPGERSELGGRWPEVTIKPGLDTAGSSAPAAELPRWRENVRQARAHLDPGRSLVRPYRFPATVAALDAALTDGPQLLQVEFTQSFRYVPRPAPCPVLLIAHDVLLRRDPRARRVPGVAQNVDLGDHRARRHERAALQQADLVVVTSEADAGAAGAAGARRVRLVPNGAPPSLLGLETGGRGVVRFVGSAMHQPNRDALRWWRSEIAPRLGDEVPLEVVGGGWDGLFPCAPWLRSRGYLSQLTDVYSDALIVAPLRVGGGTKLKVVEAMAAGRPIVATGIAAEGLPLRDGREALIRDDAASFAAAVQALRADAEMRRRLGDAAREAARPLLWPALAEAMDAIYDELLGA